MTRTEMLPISTTYHAFRNTEEQFPVFNGKAKPFAIILDVKLHTGLLGEETALTSVRRPRFSEDPCSIMYGCLWTHIEKETKLGIEDWQDGSIGKGQ